MSIDISGLFSDMAKSAGCELKEGGEAVAAGMKTVLENNKETLTELIEALKSGDLTRSEFDTEMAREKLVLEAELIGLEIQGKAAIQKAFNAAMNTLSSAVSAAI